MKIQETSLYKFVMNHHKFLSIIEGICIIILLVGVWIFYFHSSDLQKEISENCGWEGKNYECYCQKDEALALKSELTGSKFEINLSDVDT